MQTREPEAPEPVGAYTDAPVLRDAETFLLVVKSQDQSERRRRMLAKARGARLGRIEARPVAEGLLVRCHVENDRLVVDWQKPFREPRHVCRLGTDAWLLSEISSVAVVDHAGHVRRRYTHPWFSFLHTVQRHADRRRILVASSGFDMLIELALDDGEETWNWRAWEHGFNPDTEGVYLAATQAQADALAAADRQVLLVDPEAYGEQGLVTSRRSAHPNMAVYDPYHDEAVLVCIAHSGEIYRLGRQGGEPVLVTSFLHNMPHGLRPFDGGWMVTDTTVGKVWKLDDELVPKGGWDLTGVPGKLPEVGEREWVQATVPLGEGRFLALDANRGLVAFDSHRRTRYTYAVCPEWCVQDVLPDHAGTR